MSILTAHTPCRLLVGGLQQEDKPETYLQRLRTQATELDKAIRRFQLVLDTAHDNDSSEVYIRLGIARDELADWRKWLKEVELREAGEEAQP